YADEPAPPSPRREAYIRYRCECLFDPVGFHAGPSPSWWPQPNPEGTRMPRSEPKRTPSRMPASSGRAATGGVHAICYRALIAERNPVRQSGSIRFGLTDMILSVELKPQAGDKLKLSFEEVDVLLLVAHQFFKKIPAHVILDAMA